MICVSMGHEEVVDVSDTDANLRQPPQHTVATASVNKQSSGRCLQHETGVVTLGYRSIARTEHRNFIHLKVFNYPCKDTEFF